MVKILFGQELVRVGELEAAHRFLPGLTIPPLPAVRQRNDRR
jgi:hypothetical protein